MRALTMDEANTDAVEAALRILRERGIDIPSQTLAVFTRPGSHSRSEAKMGDGGLSWFQWHRLEWIEEMLRVYGFINRGHIMRKFEISTPQASLDLKAYQRLFPDSITYDRSARCYRAAGPNASDFQSTGEDEERADG